MLTTTVISTPCLIILNLQARLPRSVSTGSMVSPRESQGA